MRASAMATPRKDSLLRTACHWAGAAKDSYTSDILSFFREKQCSPAMLFLREICRAPRTMGAVCPSSRQLARRMVECIPPGDGLIVELGAGTGQVTREIAGFLEDPRRLWAVEQSQSLATLLGQRMPHINVVQGDARELSHLVSPDQPVDAIVSCLPLRAFSRQDVDAITDQWATVLAPHGIVVQFTYALWGRNLLKKHGFYEEESSMVWRNFPPARVQILKKC